MNFDPEYWMSREAYGHDDELVELLIKHAASHIEQIPLWKDYVAENANYLNDGNCLSSLYGSWDCDNCVVVGAGNSFLYNLDNIRRAQEKGYHIIAVDRAHSELRKNEIIPDLTVSMDQRLAVKDFFDEVDEKDNLVMMLAQNPAVVRTAVEQAGKVWFYSWINPYAPDSRYIFENYPKELTCVKSGSCVGYAAVDIAALMCRRLSEIVLIGHELGWFWKYGVPEMYRLPGCVFGVTLKDGRNFYSIRAFMLAEYSYSNFWNIYKDIIFIDSSGGIIKEMLKQPFEEATGLV